MPTKHLRKLLLGCIIILIVSGCSSGLDMNNEAKYASSSVDGPTISLIVGTRELDRQSDVLVSESYRKGMTIRDFLKGSGIVTFAEDSKSILSISGVTLGPGMKWELQMDGNTLKDNAGEITVNHDSNIVITAQSMDSEEPLQSVILTVNGGSRQVELTHSYVMLFSEDLTVRSLLKSFDRVQLSEDTKKVISVSEYFPISSEVWKLKVNGKQLLDNGMDMKLKPQDELEILLSSL